MYSMCLAFLIICVQGCIYIQLLYIQIVWLWICVHVCYLLLFAWCIISQMYFIIDMHVIGCVSFNHLLLHIYHCIRFQDIKQAWCKINISLLKTAFVFLHATRNYFMVSGVIGNISGICGTHEINFHQETSLFVFNLKVVGDSFKMAEPHGMATTTKLGMNFSRWTMAWEHLFSNQNELINDHSLHIHWWRGIPLILFLPITC